MTKTAVLVGCNYPGTADELGGCVNDVLVAKETLVSYLGFDESNISVLIDTDESYVSPTGSNIKGKLREMVANAQDGDILFFHFSGHGVQIPSHDGDEGDGKDEAICPTDNNLITDDDLRDIFMPLADQPNTKLTFIADCCHSGTLLDHQQVVIAGDKTQDPEVSAAVADTLNNSYGSEGERALKNRSLPFSSLSNILSQKAGGEVTTRNFADTLGSLFGPDASKKVTDIISSAQSGTPFRPAGTKPENLLPAHVGVLITGCQATETSADCAGSGAMSNALYGYIKAQYEAGKGDALTYRQLVLGVRDTLEKTSFSQNPCLECDESLADTVFVTQVPASAAAEPAAEVPTYGEPAAETTTYGEETVAAEETTYGEPAAETTTYGEETVAAEETTYGEPAAETTTYGEETVAAEETTYGEPAAENTTYGEETTYGEPAAENTTYGEETTYGEPAAENTTYGEETVAAEETTYGEPAAETTTYGEEAVAAEETTYGEPAAETTTYGEETTYGEPAAETTTYGEETVAAQETTYGEPAAETTTYGEEAVAAEETTYGEPAAETTTYGEETTYGEPAAETTTYGEETVAAQETTYGEETVAAQETTYGEPAAETTTYGEEAVAAEETTYGEPAAETTTYGEETTYGEPAAETTTYGEETVAAQETTYGEPAAETTTYGEEPAAEATVEVTAGEAPKKKGWW